METILVFGGAAIFFCAIYFGTRALAAHFGGANKEAARAALAALPGFNPDDLLVYLGSAIAYDPAAKRVAIWEKKTGARLVDAGEVGAWHAGVLVSVVGGRTTTTPMVQLYAAPRAKPFFKVGVLNERDCAPWRTRLADLFGAEKQIDVAVRDMNREAVEGVIRRK